MTKIAVRPKLKIFVEQVACDVLHGVESKVQDEIAHHVPIMHATIVHKNMAHMAIESQS